MEGHQLDEAQPLEVEPPRESVPVTFQNACPAWRAPIQIFAGLQPLGKKQARWIAVLLSLGAQQGIYLFRSRASRKAEVWYENVTNSAFRCFSDTGESEPQFLDFLS